MNQWNNQLMGKNEWITRRMCEKKKLWIKGWPKGSLTERMNKGTKELLKKTTERG